MDDERLIGLVKNYNFLHDKQDEGFKNVELIQNVWETISKEMDAPLATCMRRWCALRERYSREIRRAQPCSCSGSDRQGKSAWHWYNAMHFLKRHIKRRLTKSYKNISETVYEDVKDVKHEIDFTEMSEYITPMYPNAVPLADDSLNIEDDSVDDGQIPSYASEPGISSLSRKRRMTQSNAESGSLEGLNCFENLCSTQLKEENTVAETFGRLVTAILSEIKQAKTVEEVTALMMSIKVESE